MNHFIFVFSLCDKTEYDTWQRLTFQHFTRLHVTWPLLSKLFILINFSLKFQHRFYTLISFSKLFMADGFHYLQGFRKEDHFHFIIPFPGRLGLGTQDSHTTPQAVQFPEGTSPCSVNCGVDCSMIITLDNKLFCCGSNRLVWLVGTGLLFVCCKLELARVLAGLSNTYSVYLSLDGS